MPKSTSAHSGKKKKDTVASRKSAATAGAEKVKAGARKPAKRVVPGGLQRVIFQVSFHTAYGQELFLSGNHPLLGDNDVSKALPMQYFDEGHWYLVLDTSSIARLDQRITYNYILRNADGTQLFDWGSDKIIHPAATGSEELVCLDAWNHAGYYENSFYTEPFRKVLLTANKNSVRPKAKIERVTHTLCAKTPLLPEGHTLCVLGNCQSLGNWSESTPLLMYRGPDDEAYSIHLNLADESFPVAYKYGVFDTAANRFVRYEEGNNRVLVDSGKDNRQSLVHDGWANLPADAWKGAGIAIPVFSLRSSSGYGIGEFNDIPGLVDWARATGLQMIQLLPVNDTTATHTWTDSYPYAAISAFALHPVYLHIDKLPGVNSSSARFRAGRDKLNAGEKVDYEAVSAAKWQYIRKAYKASRMAFMKEDAYRTYFELNRHWLEPYAAFCYLRDQYGTVNFEQWPEHNQYDREAVAALTDPSSAAYAAIALHYFVQYHLHLQLKEATAYAHANGIIVKGDIAIGVYRYGADAWQAPELYHMDYQAGAPPDDFAVTGQNWGFPTYNWERMRADGFTWWKQRFAQMSDYFDAFRIDHILGFFRIWSIPIDAVEGIMGRFVPAIPVHIHEFHSRHIWFDYQRYTQPFINDEVLWEVFGAEQELVKSMFLSYNGYGQYTLKPGLRTQREIEKHFEGLEQDALHEKVQKGLYQLISNVILFDAGTGDAQQFHFRFAMENTLSFRLLDPHTQHQLRDLYNDYFFRRQDDFWKREALQKLPAMKRVTNMLVCGEDLGMVPACVPDVMRQLGLLSLEIQRMPKDPRETFFDPRNAPFLSVVTPSTHDMSTIRGWWEEDRQRIGRFYNEVLGQPGDAPAHCEAWINKAIVMQHLQSPAMWSVFQWQDLLGMDESLRHPDPHAERINIPANPKHYWQYRMHISLASMAGETAFNTMLKEMVEASGREGSSFR